MLRNNRACLEKNLEDHREMTFVLKQYAVRFEALDVKEASTDQVQLGTLDVASLKKWIERAVKIEFFDINANHGFRFKESEDIDAAIQKRMEEFEKEMESPEKAVDPVGEKVDERNVNTLKERRANYPDLQKKIDETTKLIMEKMKIPETATKVVLTYVSSSGIKPTIIGDEIISADHSREEKLRSDSSKVDEFS